VVLYDDTHRQLLLILRGSETYFILVSLRMCGWNSGKVAFLSAVGGVISSQNAEIT
jgi:hypothetical protein